MISIPAEKFTEQEYAEEMNKRIGKMSLFFLGYVTHYKGHEAVVMALENIKLPPLEEDSLLICLRIPTAPGHDDYIAASCAFVPDKKLMWSKFLVRLDSSSVPANADIEKYLVYIGANRMAPATLGACIDRTFLPQKNWYFFLESGHIYSRKPSGYINAISE